jgi:hypothetical protein
MQTFLPYPDFQRSAQVLDYRRLGKQRVEAMQILKVLSGQSKGWVNHPAVRMWRGHETALQAYYNAVVEEWVRRGYNNNMPLEAVSQCGYMYPPWLNDEFCASHRSNLLRKDPEFYGEFGWSEPNDLPYMWPV